MLRVLLSALVAAVVASPASAGESPRTGFFSTTFNERHPESAYERMAARYNWGQPEAGALYDIGQESFDLHVPAEYDGSVPYGLVVFTSASGGGNNRGYRHLMVKHRLIWIGAANVPNARHIGPRWGLALDAVWNMRQRYRIDPRRIYASGMSGGGRCASMVAPTYADVFSGAIYLVGCNEPWFPSEAVTGRPIKALALANRYALVTGSGDFNKPGTQEVHAAMQKLGFKHATYLEQPGLGHSYPSDEWFEKAILAVDGPLVAEAEARLAEAKALEAKKPFDACRIYRALPGDYPIATAVTAQARERFAALAPAQDAVLRAELAKLAPGTPGERLRALAERAAGFPCATEARAVADAAGTKEVEPVISLGSTGKSALERLSAAWAGYPSGSRAAAAYDALAAASLAPVTAQAAPARTRALARWLKDWRPCPARDRAQAQFDGDLAAELEAILAIEKPSQRGPKLVAFAKAWAGTAAAAKAEAAARALAAAPK